MKKTVKLSRKVVIIFNALLLVVLLGCNNVPKQPPAKPFIITYKFPEGQRCNGNFCSYEYTDANGRVVQFCETENKYDVGDTIK